MISKEELRVWLKDESYRPLIDDSPKHGMQVFIKVPKDEEFIYLYRQYCYDKEDVLRRREGFENSGIYSKVEGKLYFAHGYRTTTRRNGLQARRSTRRSRAWQA